MQVKPRWPITLALMQAAQEKLRIEINQSSFPKRPGKSSNLPFPAKYRDEDGSKLTATVKAEPVNAFEFKLSK